jgi:uncharacterized protein YbjQ (UPF0145 family)
MAPFGFGRGHRPSEEEERAAEVDLERIRDGGIPLGAEERLKRVGAAKTPFFTSDLSAKSYAIAQRSGLQPVAQVMGSSVVKHGWQNWRSQAGYWSNVGTDDLPAYSAPWNLSRDRAFDRLRLEAELAGADGVIGIQMTSGVVSQDPSDVEYVVFGTAVRETTLADRSADGPRLSTLTAQDVDKLRRIGAATCGVVGHTAVSLVSLGYQGSASLSRWRSGNQELIDISQGVYDTRARLMAEVTRQAHEIGANDLVITTLDHDIEHHEIEQENSPTLHFFIVTMHLLGTGIALGAHEPHPAPLKVPVMSIDLRG